MGNAVWNKADLVDMVHTRSQGLTKKEVKHVVDELLDTVMETVAEGDEVRFSGFGKFQAVRRAPRTGRNPVTGAPMPISSSISPKFLPGKRFKENLAE